MKVECFRHLSFTAFFRAEADTGFDLLAAVFYLITRYEEYLPHDKDLYGRYPHTAAVAFREGFLQQPLVNTWMEYFRQLLSRTDRGFK